MKQKAFMGICKKIFLLVYQNLIEQTLGEMTARDYLSLAVKDHRAYGQRLARVGVDVGSSPPVNALHHILVDPLDSGSVVIPQNF